MITTGHCATDDPFIVHPTNQTASYGESVNFECRVSSCGHTLTFLVNGNGAEYLNVSEVYYRESAVTCDHGQQVAMLSVIVNEKTVEAVEYVSCNWTVVANGDLCVISSNKAYIVDIVNPYQSATTYPQCPEATKCPNITSSELCNIVHKEKLSVTQITMIACILLLLMFD